jgi:hypothetical protein
VAKNSIPDYSATASLNTDIQSVNIDEGCAPSGINNAIREIMADLKDVDAGTVALTSPNLASFAVNGTTITASGAEINVLDGVTATAADLNYTAGLTAPAQDQLDDKLEISSNLSDLDNAATARTNLGLAIGSDVQAYDAGLNSIAGFTTSTNQILYTTGSNTYSVSSITAFGRSLIDDADAAASRTTLGLGTAATSDDTDFDPAGTALALSIALG